MSFYLLEDRVLVRRVEATQVSKGGIIIPDTVQEKPQIAHVTHVGPGRKDQDGNLVPMTVAVGDEVLFGKWSGDEMTVEGEKLVLLREDDIMGTLTEVE